MSIRRLKENYDEDVQSVLFDTSKWTVDAAKDWLKKKGMKYNKVDKKDKHIRFKQKDSNQFNKWATSSVKSDNPGLKALALKGIQYVMGYK